MNYLPSSLTRLCVQSLSIKTNKNNKIKPFGFEVVSMKRLSIILASLLFSLAMANSVYAGTSINWGTFPANASTVNSGSFLASVEAFADYTGWDCSEDANLSASGGCWLDNGSVPSNSKSASGTCADAKVNATVQMKSGAVTACTVHLHADMAGQTTRDETRTVFVRQIVTLVNPGSKDDVDPDYTIFANAKTADGVANTINGSTNKLSFASSTPAVCTVVSTDVNSAVIHNVSYGTCTVTATASGDANLTGANSGPISWTVVNTQSPKLALVSPVTTGASPSFVYSSNQAGAAVMLGSCSASADVTLVGNNTFKFNILSIGATYSDCKLKVTNSEGLFSILDIPPFTVTQNSEGPGGVVGVDGSSTLKLWVNGDNLPASGSISSWLDQSGLENHFNTGGGGDGSSGSPFISLQNARDRVTVAGKYYFLVGGVSFNTIVDANGYVLVASANGSTAPATYSAVTSLALQSDKVLSTPSLAGLDVVEVRMNVDGGANAGFNVTTTNGTVISQLKAGKQFPNEDDFGNVMVWSGSTSYLYSSCTSSYASTPLTQGIYHACGNGNGMHWLPNGGHEKVDYAQANTNLNLWVRGSSSTGSQPTVGNQNGFKTALFSANKFLKRTATDLNARSVLIAYNDTSTKSWVSPFQSGFASGHGATNDAAIWDATYTNNITKAGLAYYNNSVNTSGLSHARPDNFELESFIYSANYSGGADWWIGSDVCNCGDRSIEGNIAEIMVFSNAIGQAQRRILENYMYTKYFNGTYPALASPIYTYGGTASYKYNMAGIGKSSADGSLQVTAKSSLITMLNPTGLDNDEYVMWAHNNGAASFQNTDVPANIVHRLGRVWRVRNTGVSTVDVSIRVADIVNYSNMCFNFNNIRLMIDADGTFAAGATIYSGIYNPLTLSVEFTNIPMANASYIGIGVGGTPTTIFVTPKGTGTKAGTSWLNSCTLEAALNSPRLNGDVVKVSQGLHKPSATININAGVTVIGGYPAISDAEQPDAESFPTIISGDVDNNDDALGNIIMYHRDIRGTNLERLFSLSDVPGTFSLQGMMITGMSEGNPSQIHGSVMRINTTLRSANVTMDNMKFFGNRAREVGGALAMWGSQPITLTITNSIFLGNAAEHGGAIAAYGTTLNITDTQFTNNQALFLTNRGGWNQFEGGAIAANYSTVNINRNTFVGNNAYNADNATAVYGGGGAIAIGREGGATILNIADSSFSFNSARDGGGAIYGWPGFASINITKTNFTYNTATRPVSTGYSGSGGAINAGASTASGQGIINISDAEFEKNSAAALGGAVFFSGSTYYPGAAVDSYLTANIKRSSFINNNAEFGGAFFAWWFGGSSLNNFSTFENSTFTGNVSNNYGGAIAVVNGSNAAVVHSTIYNNIAGGAGGGIKVRDKNDALVLKNSIVVGNAASTGANLENSVTVIANAFNILGFNGSSGWQNIGTANAAPTGTSIVAGVTDINKILVTTLATNGGITRNYALSSNNGLGSPAFNKIPIANCLTEDQRSYVRAAIGVFTKCDIGAYESTKQDTDNDGFVDAIDNCPTIANSDQADLDGDSIGDNCDPDVDGDGVMNAEDFFPNISLGGRLDSDHDGMPDVCDAACTSAGMYADPDIDNDTVPNAADNCKTVPNQDQSDIDNDTIGDACDTDIDGDGVDNGLDNCPGVSNPLQTDSDGNGLGDDCNALFVKLAASGLGDCSSWSNACAAGTGVQLQAVIDKAYATHATLIYLARGVYKPSATVNLKKGLQIYGGFSGTTELYHYQADTVQNPTIISGDSDGTADEVDVKGITPSYTKQKGTNLAQIFNADTLGTSIGDTVSITGLTLTGAGSNSALHVKNSRVRLANIQFIGNKAVNGGGMFMEATSYAVVNDSKFIANQSNDTVAPFDGGGAVFITGANSEAVFSRCDFSSNASTKSGGAISATSGAKVNLLTTSLFDNQAVESGGAVYFDAGKLLNVVNSTFGGNLSSIATLGNGGGAIRAGGDFASVYVGGSDFIGNTTVSEGGAILVINAAGTARTVVFEDDLFKANKATNPGGAIDVVGNGIATSLTISRNSFVSNTSSKGGAINLAGGNLNQLAMDNSTFYDNRSSTVGGAMNLDNGADAAMTHITMLQNIATGNGGGIRTNVAGSIANLKNSLIIANTSTASSGHANISNGGTYTDTGYNLIGNGAASGLFNGSTANADPALGNANSKIAAATDIATIIVPALTNYSGLHKSIALTATSEARDAIPNGTNGCVTDAGYDERGFERPDRIDPTDPDQKTDVRKCDIGAFEFNNSYRIDCFDEDGLRPDQGSGNGIYYCPDGTTPSGGEIANNIVVGAINEIFLEMMMMFGLIRIFIRRKL